MNLRHCPFFRRTFALAFTACAALPSGVWGQSLPPAIGTTGNAKPSSLVATPEAKVPEAPPVTKVTYTAASLPPGGVHIPFRMSIDSIIVRANLAGRMVDCALDTGSISLTWAAWLNLPGQRHEDKSDDMTDANGLTMHETPVVLPFVRIGAFEVRDLAGFAVDTGCKNAKEAVHSDFDLDQHPLLNSAVFIGTVLTIDYKHKELIVYPAQHDAVAEAQRNDATQALPLTTSGRSARTKENKSDKNRPAFAVMPFVLTWDNREFCSGVPAVLCNFDGFVVQMEIDTGWYSPEIAIDKAFAGVLLDKHRKQGEALKLHQMSFESILGAKDIDIFPPLSFSFQTFGNAALTTHAPTALSDSFDEQPQRVGSVTLLCTSGCVSNTLLKRYARVTFDFSRNLFVLERNSPGDGSSGGGSSRSGVGSTSNLGNLGNPGSVGNDKMIDGPPLPNGGTLILGGCTLPIPSGDHIVFAPNGTPVGEGNPSSSTTPSTIVMAATATPISGSGQPIIIPMPNGGTVSRRGQVTIVPPGGNVVYIPSTGPAQIIVQNPPPSTTPPTTAPASPAPTMPTTPTPGMPTAPTPPTTP